MLKLQFAGKQQGHRALVETERDGDLFLRSPLLHQKYVDRRGLHAVNYFSKLVKEDIKQKTFFCQEKNLFSFIFVVDAKIANRIREIRGGRTQAAFGRLIGRSQNAVKNYEKGQIPKLSILRKIAAQDARGRGLNYLLHGERYLGTSENHVTQQSAAAYGDVESPAGRVIEEQDESLSEKRVRLVREIKDLMATADEGVVDALLKNVEQFSRIKKKDEETS